MFYAGEMEMDKRRSIFSRGALPGLWSPALAAFALCAVCFALGVVSGTALSSGFAGGDAADRFFSGYVESLRSGAVRERLTPLFLGLCWYHILTFLLGFTMLGVPGIPLISAVRGFTLSFTLATLVRLYDAGGAAAGLVLIGLPALVSVPVFFPLAVDAMCASWELVRTGLLRQPPSGRRFYSGSALLRFLAVLLLLLLISAGERALLGSDFLELPIFP